LRSVEMITETLLSIGALEGDRGANIKSMSYRKFYPHGLGHYLGLDVHDIGIYKERGRDFELKAGMLMTNEPGLYFRERGNPYYGIGVRIEDDLLITESGAECLTHELPREVSAIENLRTIATT
jgi:Xaa-Pro aminopeptidase